MYEGRTKGVHVDFLSKKVLFHNSTIIVYKKFITKKNKVKMSMISISLFKHHCKSYICMLEYIIEEIIY